MPVHSSVVLSFKWPSKPTTSPSTLLVFTDTLAFLHFTPTLVVHSYMPAPQPPYPSFTWVMSSTPFTAHDNMRLPAYRASHLARFHPYPRAHPSLHETTQRFSEHSRGPVRGVTPIAPAMDPKDNRKTENKSEISTVPAESILRRQKLKTAAGRLSAVIVTLRRMYRGTSAKQTEQRLQFELMN